MGLFAGLRVGKQARRENEGRAHRGVNDSVPGEGHRGCPTPLGVGCDTWMLLGAM